MKELIQEPEGTIVPAHQDWDDLKNGGVALLTDAVKVCDGRQVRKMEEWEVEHLLGEDAKNFVTVGSAVERRKRDRAAAKVNTLFNLR